MQFICMYIVMCMCGWVVGCVYVCLITVSVSVSIVIYIYIYVYIYTEDRQYVVSMVMEQNDFSCIFVEFFK